MESNVHCLILDVQDDSCFPTAPIFLHLDLVIGDPLHLSEDFVDFGIKGYRMDNRFQPLGSDDLESDRGHDERFPLQEIEDFAQPPNQKIGKVLPRERNFEGARFRSGRARDHETDKGIAGTLEKILEIRALYPEGKIGCMVEQGVMGSTYIHRNILTVDRKIVKEEKRGVPSERE
jgi:hypothetical protein